MAPEVFDKERGHGKSVDLYAVGIIMYILYADRSQTETYNKGNSYRSHVGYVGTLRLSLRTALTTSNSLPLNGMRSQKKPSN